MYVELVGCLRHFTQLQSLSLVVDPAIEMVSSWELIASFLSTVSPHSNLKDLSISVYLAVPSSGEVRIYFTKECEFVLENAEALDLILDNSFKGLLTLDLYLNLHWGPEFRNKSEWIRIKLSQSAVE